MKRFAARLRRLRRARKMTQADLAARARLTRVYVVKLEGAQQDPSLTTLTKLARALRVKVAALVE